MLHEILLSLSGHASPLFDAKDGHGSTERSIDLPLLSPPEQALLQSIGRLSRLHRSLREHAARISSSHGSTIARAVATSITTVHLARFQKKILDVEAKILKRDASSVGAYNIVPLAGVVGEFDEWTRRLEWLWQLVCFIQPTKSKSSTKETERPCSGAGLIDKLRQEAQTGYPDIEETALELGKVAETAWLRQLSTWVLYGRLPMVGAQDFFVQKVEATEAEDIDYESISALLPRFISRDTASSILFIGKSLNTIRSRAGLGEKGAKTMNEMELVPIHLKYLSSLVFPLSSSALSNSISAIRLSLSKNTLQQLLPLASIVRILTLLRDFFLLRRGEFAISLVNEADACIRSRSRSSKAADNLKGMLIKEAELTTILTKTFATVASNSYEDVDPSLDFARSLLHLQSARPTSTRPSTPGRAKAEENLPRLSLVSFTDFLLPTNTSMHMDIIAPFDLFLTPAEVSIYANLQAYILSIRRSHLRLCSLWQQTPLRRVHPSYAPTKGKVFLQKQLAAKRERATTRNTEMRPIWATSSASVFLLGELGNYFEGEVIDDAWEHLRKWICQEPGERPGSARSRPTSSKSGPSGIASSFDRLNLGEDDDADPAPAPHDPALLTLAHRKYLTALSHSLLVTDVPFTTALHALLQHIDLLVALTIRLQGIQESLDLETDEGVVDPMGNFAKEEEEVKRDLGRARKRVDGSLRAVVGRLRELDHEGGGRDGEEELGEDTGSGAFVPLRGAGVERLLMRVEGQRRVNEDGDGEDGGAEG